MAKVQKTFRMPRTIHDEIERRALAQSPPSTFQKLALEMLTQAVIEADPMPAADETSDKGSAPVAPSSDEESSGLSLSELAKKFRVTPRTMQNWAHEHSFPRPVGKERKAMLYAEDDVMMWAAANKRVDASMSMGPAAGGAPSGETIDLEKLAKLTEEITRNVLEKLKLGMMGKAS